MPYVNDAPLASATARALQKALETCRARAALLGIALHVIDGDDGRPLFVATRWALTKNFADLAEVEAWLDRVGGKQ